MSAVLALAGVGLVAVNTGSAAAAVPQLPAGCVQSAVGGAVTCTFGHTGGSQTFAVPAGVNAVSMTAYGGHGAATDQAGSPPGGAGAQVGGSYELPQGTAELTVYVAGDGNGNVGG